ncbi:MAG: CHASE3 domain-containing protein [Burkholderiaceae bacterium]|nr:CHASE3 domain-containing protein [Burkholderiaceae bacterium]
MPLKRFDRFWRSAFAFPVACLAAMALLVISEVSFRRATNSMNQLAMMATARTDIQALWRQLVDAETGQRGYLLTQRSEYLKPYRESLERIGASIRSLTTYYQGHPQGEPLMGQLSSLSKDKISELATTLRLYDEGGEAWRELLMTNIGQEKMESIRTTAQQLLDLETQRVLVGRADVHRTLMINRVGVGLTTLISLLALSLYFRQSTLLVRVQREQKLAVQVERDRLDAEVKSRTAQLTELAQHLQTAREDERSRLARELHDELGALLTAAKLDAARLKARLGTMTPEVAERLLHLNKLLNDGIALKRQIIENLRPSSLSNLGLVAALEIVTSEFATASGLQIHTMLEPVQLSNSGELTTYRLVQEALTNIAKYAKASEVWVVLSQQGANATISVRDNGCGFDTTIPRQAAHGLLGMRYRVEAEGGQMTLSSEPGHGTLIEASLPVRKS